MARFSIVLICLLVAVPSGVVMMESSASPPRSTTVPGGMITSSSTWNAAGSPYVLEGNLTVSPTGTLTLDKGVTLNIAKGVHIEIQGKFIVKGTESEQVLITDNGVGAFDGINFTAGSYGRFEKLNLTGGKYGIDASGEGSTVHILNSTVQSSGAAVASKAGAVVWTVNSTIKGSPRLRVQSGELYECWWLFFSVVMDNGKPWKTGADLKATVNREFDSRDAYNAFDMIDPQTDTDGRVRAIPIEEYFHDGTTVSFQNTLYLRMTAVDPERSWSKNSGNIEISGNIDYIWNLDTTPPPAPLNFSVNESGGTYLVLEWEWDHVPNDHQLGRFEVKYALSGETVYQTEIINVKTQRECNLTGLETEKDYKVYLQAIDIYGNSAKTPTLDASTRDVAKPFAPYNLSIRIENRLDAVIAWDLSASSDVVGYEVFMNDTTGGKTYAGFADGKTARKHTVTNLTSETEYTFWVRAVDDGIPPNYSPFGEAGSATTGDITPPVKPVIELYLVSPTQYILGSPYYNRTYVGIRGSVEGENRTFIDVYVNEIKHEFSEAERPKTLGGKFTVYIFLQEGEHKIQASSIDPTGNVGPLSDELQVIVDRTLPVIEFPRHVIEADANEEIELKVNATDTNGIANITWTIKGESFERILIGDSVKTKMPAGSYEASCEVVDRAGNRNVSAIQVKCWVPDLIPPLPKRTDPQDNAAGVQVDAKIVIEFEEALKWDLLKGVLAKASAPNVPILSVMQKDESNKTVTFTPAETLGSVTDYIFTLSGIYDLRGNHGYNVTIRFTTLDPALFDSDGDGIPNFYEVQRSAFLSPSDPDDAAEDYDQDGLTNIQEYECGADPALKDTDEDGMDDGWEKKYGLSPTDKTDALKDDDSDDYSNLDEFNDKTDPLDPKSHREETKTSYLGFVIGGVVVVVLVLGIGIAIWAFGRKKPIGKGDETEEKAGLPESQAGGYLGTVETETLPAASDGSSSCASCGASITDDLDYCPECGAVIAREGDKDPAASMMEEDEPVSGSLDSGMGAEVPTLGEEETGGEVR